MTDDRSGAPDDQWWKSAVVYQVYPRSFADSTGDGVGDLRGITAHLDHLVALGVDVLWLSPVYASPQADNGYDISDYQAVDPLFGTLDDLDALLTAAHERGIKLLMDLVVNHTSDEHPWFLESRSSTDNPKRDWYWWRPPRDGYEPGHPGAEPTNWESVFSGPAWALDHATGEYYLHLFDRKQPDLNWENPQVRQAIYAMMRWWLDRGVDGFRMDVINFIAKDPALPDGSPTHGGFGDGWPFFGTLPRVHDYLQEMHREVLDGRDAHLMTVGEMPGVTWQEARLFTDPARREVDMVFQFEHVGLDQGPGGKFDPVPLDLRALKASLGRWQTELGDVGWNSLYWNNHDQPRVVSRFGDDERWWRESATALATVLHLHRGTPYVYQGEELGMTNAPFAGIEDVRDVESLNYWARAGALGRSQRDVLRGIRAMGRDNARTPMQWDGTAEAGFTAGTPWLATNPNHTWLNARAQYDDPASVFHHYRRLIELRHTMPVIVHGDFHMLFPEHPTAYVFERRLAGEALLVAANIGAEPVELELDRAWDAAALLLTNGTQPRVGGGSMHLPPWAALVLHRTG